MSSAGIGGLIFRNCGQDQAWDCMAEQLWPQLLTRDAGAPGHAALSKCRIDYTCSSAGLPGLLIASASKTNASAAVAKSGALGGAVLSAATRAECAAKNALKDGVLFFRKVAHKVSSMLIRTGGPTHSVGGGRSGPPLALLRDWDALGCRAGGGKADAGPGCVHLGPPRGAQVCTRAD